MLQLRGVPNPVVLNSCLGVVLLFCAKITVFVGAIVTPISCMAQSDVMVSSQMQFAKRSLHS